MSQSMPTISRLCDLAPGERGDFFALLAERKPGVTSKGKPYFHCRFRDARRVASFMVWADDKWYGLCQGEWQAGQFFKIRAVYEEHEQYGPQIEVVNLRAVTPADRDAGFDEGDFVEASRHDLDQLWDELRGLALKHVGDEGLRALVLDLLETHGDRLKRLPAGKDKAYPYRGGWLEHTVSVARVAVDLAARYAAAWPDLRPPLNRDLIVAGAILHDLGRVKELEGDAAVSVTVEGRLFGHVLLGRDLVRDAAREAGLEGELTTLLEHVLLASVYGTDGGGTKWPLVPEGVIVQHANDLDVKLAACVRALQRDPGPGPFTERDPVVGRALLKGRKV